MTTDFRQQKDKLPGIRNNNPGNLRPGHDWQHMVCDKGNFVVFDDARWGCRALAMDLINKNLRGLKTVWNIISVYAPPSENNTTAYVDDVKKALNVKYNDPFKFNEDLLFKFMRAVIDHENGKEAKIITDTIIREGIDLIPDTLKNYLKS